MNTAKRDKIILSVLIIIVIAAIMYYVAINPSVKKIKDLNAKIDSASSDIDGFKNKQNQIDDLQIKLDEMNAKVAEKEGDMSKFGDSALYLSDFQDITENRATSTKILFTDIAASESGQYSIIRANISFECKYDDFKYIMTKLFESHVHCYDVKVTASGAVLGTTEDDESDVDSTLTVSFTADYVSCSGLYTPIDYDFLSDNYGLSELFDGLLTGAPIVNEDVELTA